MPYSAVTQPWFLPRRNPGTPSSTLAVHSTRVLPNSTSTEPSACCVKRRVNFTARSSSGARPLGRASAIADPAHHGGRSVVGTRTDHAHRSFGQAHQLFAQRRARRRKGAADILVFEPAPQAIGAG